jgi:hypothetical protein
LTAGSFVVLTNLGGGAFSGPQATATNQGPTSILLRDLNGDGNLDLVYVRDSRAVNGVQFEYTLVDVDRLGNETRHPSVSAIANPINPRIKLGSPAYSTRLGLGSRTTYSWTPVPLSGATLRISPDASFPVGSTMSIGISPRQAATGLLALNHRQDFAVQALASRNGGVVYWQIVTKPVGAASDHSATFRYTYDSPGSAKIVDVKYRVKAGSSRSDR